MDAVKAPRTHGWRLAAAGLAGLVALAGCRDIVQPRGSDLAPLPDPVPGDTTVVSEAAGSGDPPLSVAWAATARGLIVTHRPSVPAAARQLAYLGLAQYAAVAAAEERPPRPRAEVEGAVAGASAALLTHFFPAEAAAMESLVRSQEPAAPGGRRHFALGEELGRKAARRVIERARTDRFDAVFTGTIPVGPGHWFSSMSPPAPPLAPRLGEMRPFFLRAGSQHRPAPPPAFGSAEYLAGLAEVRQVALGRTEEQARIARFWALPPGTPMAPGYWNEVGAALVAESRMDEREAARAFLLLNGAMMDALIAGHDAKYAYWFIRPSQADPSIALAIGMPNHPSYPSTHTALSKTAAGVLASLFPRHREHLSAMAEEASLSRLYGGIHYRFDLEAGAAIARGVAGSALRAERGKGPESLLP